MGMCQQKLALLFLVQNELGASLAEGTGREASLLLSCGRRERLRKHQEAAGRAQPSNATKH